MTFANYSDTKKYEIVWTNFYKKYRCYKYIYRYQKYGGFQILNIPAAGSCGLVKLIQSQMQEDHPEVMHNQNIYGTNLTYPMCFYAFPNRASTLLIRICFVSTVKYD